jgi:hypothetical protein
VFLFFLFRSNVVVIFLLWLVALALQEWLKTFIADELAGGIFPLKDRANLFTIPINPFGKAFRMIGRTVIGVANWIKMAHEAHLFLAALILQS